MPYSDKEKAREYNKTYHLRTWLERKAKHKKKKQQRRIELSSWLKDYKLHLVCLHCMENHPACLDFHHLDASQKEGTIGNMISEGYSIRRIQNEISKCIILCKNCHAKEHFRLKSKQ